MPNADTITLVETIDWLHDNPSPANAIRVAYNRVTHDDRRSRIFLAEVMQTMLATAGDDPEADEFDVGAWRLLADHINHIGGDLPSYAAGVCALRGAWSEPVSGMTDWAPEYDDQTHPLDGMGW